MPSPFPGMDPYLEERWGDFHTRLSVYAADQLQKVLPSDLVARIEERLVVTNYGERDEWIRPDLYVREQERPRRASKQLTPVTVTEPVVVKFLDEPETQRFIEIREKGASGRVVTTIELLSPTNKRHGSQAKEDYREKQEKLLDAEISLVEIDLIRGGDWVVAVPFDYVRPEHRTAYRVVVRRGWEFGRAELYPITLQQKLPTVKVPLREGDTDAPLQLQLLIEQCYEIADYYFDYNAEPHPPLTGADAKWADQLLRKAGLRGKKKRK